MTLAEHNLRIIRAGLTPILAKELSMDSQAISELSGEHIAVLLNGATYAELLRGYCAGVNSFLVDAADKKLTEHTHGYQEFLHLWQQNAWEERIRNLKKGVIPENAQRLRLMKFKNSIVNAQGYALKVELVDNRDKLLTKFDAAGGRCLGLLGAKARQQDMNFISSLRNFNQLVDGSNDGLTDWQITRSVMMRFREPWLDLLLLLMLSTGELKQSSVIKLEDADVAVLNTAVLNALEIVRAGERAAARGTRHILALESPALVAK